jgi:hypothetical protein
MITDSTKEAKETLESYAAIDTQLAEYYGKTPEILNVEKVDQHVEKVFKAQIIKHPDNPLINLK